MSSYIYGYYNNKIVNIDASIVYSISKITVVYTSGKEVDINLSSINLQDYPALVLGDLYND